MLEEIFFGLQNHHLQSLCNYITQNRGQGTQDLSQVHKVVVENVIKVILRRAAEQGTAKATDMIKIIICVKEGNGAQIDEQDFLKRQLIFADSLICHHEGAQTQQERPMEVDEGSKAPASSASPSALLIQTLKSIIKENQWPRCQILMRAILMLNSKYHKECFQECLGLVKLLISATPSFETLIK